jgi:PAS domain-containing protein
MEQDIWRILLVEDDEEDYFLAREMITEARPGKIRVDWAPTFETGHARLGKDGPGSHYDVMLVDYDLGEHTGIELIQAAHQAGLRVPSILLTGRGSFEVDVEAMQAGAADYLNKGDINPSFLERSIRYAIDRYRSEEALAQANQSLASVNLALAAANATLAKANQQIQQERARLDAIIENAPSGILMTDRGGGFVISNPAVDRLFRGGVTGTASGPDGGYTLHRPDGAPFAADELPLVQTLATGNSQENIEVLVRHQDSSESFLLVNTNPIRDMGGGILGAVAVLQDITDLKKIEAERERLLADNLRHQASLEQQRTLLELQNELLEQIIEYAPVGIALLQGPDLRFILANPAYRELARGKGELVMRPVAEVWPEIAGTLTEIISSRKTPWPS